MRNYVHKVGSKSEQYSDSLDRLKSILRHIGLYAFLAYQSVNPFMVNAQEKTDYYPPVRVGDFIREHKNRAGTLDSGNPKELTLEEFLKSELSGIKIKIDPKEIEAQPWKAQATVMLLIRYQRSLEEIFLKYDLNNNGKIDAGDDLNGDGLIYPDNEKPKK